MNPETHEHSKRRDSGYTLLEMTAAITLGVLVFGLVAGAFVFGQRQFQAYHERTRLENAAQLVSRTITGDVYRSDGEIYANAEGTVITIGRPAQVQYELRDGILLRKVEPDLNSIPVAITSEDIRVTRLTVRTMPDAGKSAREIRVALTLNGKHEMNFETTVSARRPKGWERVGAEDETSSEQP